MIKDAVVSYRIPAELKVALQKLADADKRKLGPYIQIVLEEHVQGQRGRPPGKRK
jgi:predicted DNA-binding protein